MKKLFFIFPMILFPVLATAKDFGYSHTEWGMNPNQVVVAEGDRAHIVEPMKYKKGIGKVQIDSVIIAASTYTVTFIFDDSDHLIQTNVISDEKKNVGTINMQFDQLSRLLSQKYGEPQFKGNNAITWKTSSTTIELTRSIIANLYAQVSVRYIPNSTIEKDTSNL